MAKILDRQRYGAHGYPSYYAQEKNVIHGDCIQSVAPAVREVKPYRLSHYKAERKTIVVSSTFKVFANETNPYIGILDSDTQCGERGLYWIDKVYALLPVSGTVANTVNHTNTQDWVGKTAYMICEGENWGVSTEIPQGAQSLKIGVFSTGIQFADELGITYGDRFALVYIQKCCDNSPIIISNNEVDCDFNCNITAFPIIYKQKGGNVEFELKVFANHPAYTVSDIQISYNDGQNDVVLSGADAMGLHTLRFKVEDTYNVTLKAKVEPIDGSCDCGCGDDSTCCYEDEITINISPVSSVPFCEPVTPTSTNNWILSRTFLDSDVSVINKIKEIVVVGSAGTTTYTCEKFADNTSAIITDIQAALDQAGVGYSSVTYDWTAGNIDGSLGLLSGTIINADSELVSATVRLYLDDGTTEVDLDFEVLPS